MRRLVTIEDDDGGIQVDWSEDSDVSPGVLLGALSDAIGILYGIILIHEGENAGTIDDVMSMVKNRVERACDAHIAGDVELRRKEI